MNGRGKPLYIVDGYNVILSDRFGRRYKGIEEGRNSFIKLIDSYASAKSVNVAVVWDGEKGIVSNGSRSRVGGRVRILYSNPPQNADQKIVKMVESTRNRKGIIVVSNDRKHITGVVKNLGAKTMSAEQFLSLINLNKIKAYQPVYMNKVKNTDGTFNKEETNDLSVDEWLKFFRVKKDEK